MAPPLTSTRLISKIKNIASGNAAVMRKTITKVRRY